MVVLGPRNNSLVVASILLLVLFLITLAFNLMVAQRAPALHGGEVQTATSLLLRVLGGLFVLLLLYAAFSRVTRRGRPTETGVVIDAFHDVVRRLREKEQELESYNENILRSVSSGVITFNQAGVVTTFNEAAAGILRLRREDVIGKTCVEVFGAQSVVARLLARALAHGDVITREEFELEVPHGGKIWVGVSTSLLKDHAGGLIGTTFVCTDLTEIKELQERVELRERMMVLGEMSAGIAHEFRNLMGTILGAGKLIARQLPGGSPIHESVQTITHVISDMDHLVTQLLNFARKTEPDLKPVALEPWLKRAVEQVFEQAPAPNLRVEVRCVPDLPVIRMDEILMRQALSNLVQNAIEAMPAGGGLTVSVGVRALQGRRLEVEMKITDTGVGIRKDRLARIFLPFFTMKAKGTGLGLALVHKIVLLHNGRIEVESLEGTGTTFHVYLPVG
ncbi:MAG: PAS domain S-box protein [Nitrospiraceae bacterium]|nr:MAG: PAS domain S-box protein [Nitrospiraceae bacterium]